MLAKIENALSMDILRREQQRIGGLIKDNKLFPIGPHLSALLPLEPATDLQRRWHVVQTEPQQESDVAEQIDKAKLDVFYPREPGKVRVGQRGQAHRHRPVMRPMLPGYVFAGFDVGWDPWECIIDKGDGKPMRGAVRLIKIGERPVPVPEWQIDHLRMLETKLAGGECRKASPTILVTLKSLVKILEPFAFAGLFGTVEQIDQKQRLIGVEIDIFGRLVPLSLTPEQVEAV
jgi:transcription antitermination factor NusG